MPEPEDAPHVSVMLNECVAYLNVKADGRYIDGTMGAGGHTKAILEQSSNVSVLAIDKDNTAIAIAQQRLKEFEKRLTIRQGNFKNMKTYADQHNWKSVDGILLDLGVSSMQIDDAARGFSYMHNGPLDMRMDRSAELTASTILNTKSESELTDIFKYYGEEPRARQIAKAIVADRKKKLWTHTEELSALIGRIAGNQKGRKLAEARCFQALRIAVNDEITDLETVLGEAVQLLNPGGRLVVMSFHSLEDRAVKKQFQFESSDCVCPSDFPECRCDKTSTINILTRKPVMADDNEIQLNKRSSSAKLRAAERI